MQNLQFRCVAESDVDVRVAIATALGEVGAIDPNRLGGGFNTIETIGDGRKNADQHLVWRKSQPPWRSQIVRYELQLVTNLLTVALKASPTAMDQHKISFAIQELLILLNEFSNNSSNDSTSIGVKSSIEDDIAYSREITTTKKKPDMNDWLKSQLQKASVLELVEPFWSTQYQQVRIIFLI